MSFEYYVALMLGMILGYRIGDLYRVLSSFERKILIISTTVYLACAVAISLMANYWYIIGIHIIALFIVHYKLKLATDD